MEIFYWKKTFHTRKKIRKNYFAPSEKFSCYAPALHTQTFKSCQRPWNAETKKWNLKNESNLERMRREMKWCQNKEMQIEIWK